MKNKKNLLFALLLMAVGVLHAQTTTYNSPGQTITLTNATFNGDVRIQTLTTVVIPQGVTIKMKTGKKIFVEGSGAKLVIDGGIVTHEDDQFIDPRLDFWGGIEVWGNKNLTQLHISFVLAGTYPGNNANTQGVVIAKNNAQIKFASTGIRVGKLNGSVPDLQYSGGIVYAENTEFVDNTCAVQFHDYPSLNASRFVNSKFYAATYAIQTPPSNPQECVRLNYVRGLQFTNCLFQGTYAPIISAVDQMNDGITSVNSGFSVRNCTFKFIKHGVKADNTFKNGEIAVEDNTFQICGKSAYIKGVDAITFRRNIVYGLHQGDLTGQSYGVYLEGNSGFRVRDNQFSKFTTNDNSRAIYITNSGSFGNTVRNNTFTDNTGGIQAQDNNMGLQIRCNVFSNFSNPDNTGFRDALVLASSNTPSALRGIPNQGFSGQGSLSTDLAGNRFSYQCNNNSTRWGTPITTADYTAGSNVNNFDYHHHNDPNHNATRPKCLSTNKITRVASTLHFFQDRDADCAILTNDLPSIVVVLNRNKSRLAFQKAQVPVDVPAVVYLEKEIQSNIHDAVNLYLDEENITGAITFLNEEKDDFKRSLLVPLHIELEQYEQALVELNAISPIVEDGNPNLEMIDFKAYYGLIIPHLVNGNTHFANLTVSEMATLTNIAQGATATAAKAKNLLSLFYGYTFNEVMYVYEELGKKATGLVAANKNNTAINIYPVPAKEVLYLTASEELTLYQIFDVNGKQVLVGNLQQATAEINIGSLPNGVYAVVLTDKQQQQTTKRFSINK